jgi:signal transduction histidine kinase
MDSNELQKIIHAAELVNSNLGIKEVLINIVNEAVELTNADRGTLYLVDKEKQEVWSLIALGTEMQEIRLKIGEGLAGYVARTGETVNLHDARLDPRFNPDFDRLFGYNTKSMICFPIKQKNDEIIGVLQLLNSFKGSFTKKDEDFLKAFSIHSAIALNNAFMLQKQIEINKELDLAKNEAEKFILLKTHFMMQMSHEIRTPLNIILNGTELLKMNHATFTPAEFNEIFVMMEKGSQRIIRTIDEMIELSAINSGNYDIHLTKFNLESEILLPIIQRYDYKAVNKGLQLIYVKNSGSDDLYLDKYMVYHIFEEIIDNAIKFTDAGEITITELVNSNNKLTVTISDTGIGMSKEFLGKIFEPFVQEYTGYSRKFEGNGIALALVKKYAELNNITIDVKSRKDKGTEFTLTIY